MAFRGERFVLDLDEDDDGDHHEPSAFSPLNLIGEIREREPSAAVPPAPKPPSGTTGFPQHRQRSAFKQRRAAQQQPTAVAKTAVSSSSVSGRQAVGGRAAATNVHDTRDDKKAIDEENRRHLASMSSAQIERERAELMSSMEPSLLERFLRRARIDDNPPPSQAVTEASSATPAGRSSPKEQSQTPKKAVSFDTPPKPSNAETAPAEPTTHTATASAASNDDLPPAELPTDLHPASEAPPPVSFHFPTPPPRRNPMPNLDPSSPSFLSDLQTHYFPEMSHNPSALSWLQLPSNDAEDPASSTSAYHPSSRAVSVSPSALRFSLTGTLLSPSTALSLPTTLGLHHHGADPHAAGYTIPELAILSRSSFPAQRCIAWQVLGRILFRLGKGQFGERGSTLVDGLWDVIEKEGVVAGMLAEADGMGRKTQGQEQLSTATTSTSASTEEQDTEKTKEENGARSTTTSSSSIGKHASATAWAVEGVWLWQMGGGGDRGLLKEGVIRSQ